MMRCRTITRAAGASLIASIVALLVWVFISAVDQYYGGPLVAMMTGWFGMQSIIVEETSLNIIAVLGGVLGPFSTPLPLHRHPLHEAQGAEVPQVAARLIHARPQVPISCGHFADRLLPEECTFRTSTHFGPAFQSIRACS